jgi:tetraprenyl-beta-curcumene synthase
MIGKPEIREIKRMNGLHQQTATLARATGRELVWGLRGVSREVAGWRERAAAIPDPRLRADALEALARKRGSIDGAALFWILPRRRNPELLGVLVAYEVLADYLDCVNERGAERGIENGCQLHLALVEAVDSTPPTHEISDYYRYHCSGEDGGYARALVERCRAGCEQLPSYEAVKPFLMRAAGHSGVLGLNHEPDPARREEVLRQWADDHRIYAEQAPVDQVPAHPAAERVPALRGRNRSGGVGNPSDPSGQRWYERAAGSSAWVTVLAMLALAARPGRAVDEAVDGIEVARTYNAYTQWVAPTGAMLDSFADVLEDAASGDHSYIAHYPSMDVAVQRIGELVRQSRREIRALPGAARHSVVLSCMIAFFLSKDSVRGPELRSSARELRRAGGPLVELLLPVLCLWRTAYGQRSA